MNGTPDNSHVGPWDVYIEIDDGLGHSEIREFRIKVINTDPEILNDNLLEVYEDEEYYVDYSSSDDGQGEVTWEKKIGPKWLSLNKDTGELTGTPIDDDRGVWTVRILVEDGNGGENSTTFDLEVINVNKPPEIISADMTKGHYLHF